MKTRSSISTSPRESLPSNIRISTWKGSSLMLRRTLAFNHWWPWWPITDHWGILGRFSMLSSGFKSMFICNRGDWKKITNKLFVSEKIKQQNFLLWIYQLRNRKILQKLVEGRKPETSFFPYCFMKSFDKDVARRVPTDLASPIATFASKPKLHNNRADFNSLIFLKVWKWLHRPPQADHTQSC